MRVSELRVIRVLAGGVVGVFLLGILLSVVAGTPPRLPSVALDWPVLFHAERAGALTLVPGAIGLIAFKAWHGSLPTKLSTGGVEWADTADSVEQTLEDKQESTSRDVRLLIERLNSLVTELQGIGSEKVADLARLKGDAERTAREASLTHAVNQLPEREKIVFVLRDIEGFTRAEVAEILGVSVATITRVEKMARARLEGLLEN